MDDNKLELEIKLLHKRICHALADPTRILILYHLAEKPRFVNELVDTMGLPQSTMSRHLGVLRDRSLVDTERDGTAIRYFLTDKRIIEALDIMRAVLASQLAQSAEIARTLSE